MKKKIILAVVSLMLVICFPITSYAASFDSEYWGTVMENVTYYYGSAGYNVTCYEYNGGYYDYFHFENLASDSEVLEYLTYSHYNLDPEYVYSSDGTVYTCNIGYLWWVPLGNVIYTPDNSDLLYFDVYICNSGTVTLPSGSTTSVVAGSNFLQYQTLDSDSYNKMFDVVALKDDGSVVSVSSDFYSYGLPQTVAFSLGTDYLNWPSTFATYTYLTFKTDTLSEYTALGIKLMGYSSVSPSTSYGYSINPYVVFGIDDTRNAGTITYPEPSNKEVLNAVESLGVQISNMEQSLLEPDQALSDSLESQNQQKDEALDVGDEILDAMDRIEKPDYNQAKDAVDIYLQDYDVDLARKYLGFVTVSPYLASLVVLPIFFSLLSFVLFGKKA